MQSESRRDCGAEVSSCISLHCLLSSHVLILYSLFVSLLTCLRAANTKQRLFVITVYSTLVWLSSAGLVRSFFNYCNISFWIDQRMQIDRSAYIKRGPPPWTTKVQWFDLKTTSAFIIVTLGALPSESSPDASTVVTALHRRKKRIHQEPITFQHTTKDRHRFPRADWDKALDKGRSAPLSPTSVNSGCPLYDQFSIPTLRDHINKLNENFKSRIGKATIFKPFLDQRHLTLHNLQSLTIHNPTRPYPRLRAGRAVIV